MAAGTALVPIEKLAQQLGVTLLPDNKTHEYRMEVRSRSTSDLYIVSRRKATRIWECGCMGWIRHHGKAMGGQYLCGHLRPMVPVLEAGLSPRAVRG